MRTPGTTTAWLYLQGIIALCGALFLSQGCKTDGFSESVTRMGSSDVSLFDENWLFARYGLQPEGTTLPEPDGLQNPDAGDAGWRKLDLPHDWAIEGPFRIELDGSTGKLPYKGIGWYRKHFLAPTGDEGKMIFLDFDGAMAYAQVWLNGNYLGTWPYGYSSFRMDLTPYLKFGQNNVLAVRLDTEKWDSRWYPGAGIYRHVWIVKTEPVHVAHWGTFITTPEITNASATVKLDVTLNNDGKMPVDAVVESIVYELGADNIPGSKVAAFEKSTLTIEPGRPSVSAGTTKIVIPKKWDVDSPNRYIARTTVTVNGKVADIYNTPLGIRTLEFTARNGFLLNGRRVEIRGTCNHHDLGALGTAINTSALRRQLSILKEMGCNALRTSHNPPAPELLELADQMGFLVWDEAFDAWKTGKLPLDYNKLYDEWHEQDLRAMVRRDRNHPSVFIWSIGNEVREQRDFEMNKHLADIIHSEDPTRPVSNGFDDPDGSREAGSVLGVDITGINYRFGQQARWDADPRYSEMPTLGSETSSCVSSRGEYFFETLFANWQISSYDLASPPWGCIPDDQFRINARFPHLMGEFVWTGFDYLGEPTPYYSSEVNLHNLRNDPTKKAELEKKMEEIRKTTPPSRSSYFGIVDLCGFPKDRFYLYQSQWRPDLPMAHILPHWNWEERIGQVIPVHVYTSGTEAELFINGKSLGRKVRKAGQDFRLVWDSVVYEPGQVKVVSYKDGSEWASDEVKTTGKASRIGLSADRNRIGPEGTDLAFVTVKIQDNNSLTVPGSRLQIRFEVEGPGEIVATDNGDPTSFVPFKSNEREAFNGMALVIVKARKDMKGVFTVRASGEGLETGQVRIEAR